MANTLLIVACSKKIEIRMPTFLTVLTFDIYLAHNNVLMAMKDNFEMVYLVSFIFITFVATVIFYLFRDKVLGI